MAPRTQDIPLFKLPPELRLKIYDFLFAGAKIHIHPPINLYRIEKYKTPEQDRLPGILMVSHQIRDEALPHFAKHLTPIFYRHPYTLAPIPPIYLSQTRTVWLADRWSSPVTRTEVPNLEEVKVLHMGYQAPDQHSLKICGYTTVHEPEKDIVNRIFPKDSPHSLCFVDKPFGGECVPYKAWLKQHPADRPSRIVVSFNMQVQPRFPNQEAETWQDICMNIETRQIIRAGPRPCC